jgi:hypothetical protein
VIITLQHPGSLQLSFLLLGVRTVASLERFYLKYYGFYLK